MRSFTRSDNRTLILLSLYGAILFGSQVALSGLPNIEIVTLLVILLTTVYGATALLPVYIFVMLEGFFWGFNDWWIGYLYVWTILVGIVLLLRKFSHVLLWTVVAGTFGLAFGTLMAPVKLVIGGPGYALGWIISGLKFDVVHCIGNVATTLTLFVPLQKVMIKGKTGFFKNKES